MLTFSSSFQQSLAISMGADMQLGSQKAPKERDYNNVVGPYSKLQMAKS